MDILVFIAILPTFLLTLVVIYLLRRFHEVDQRQSIAFKNQLQLIDSQVKHIYTRIEKIFTIDTSSPNEATNDDDSTVEFSENIPIVPKDLKFEIEGGDSMTPPGFDEKDKV